MAAPRILLELDDGKVIAVDKPAGLPSTGKTRADPRSLEAELAALLEREVWALHQLDEDTSGVMLFATRRSLVAEWQKKLAHPGTHKSYLAIVHGVPAWKKQRIDAALEHDEGSHRVVVSQAGKPAATLVRVLSSSAGYALLEARLLTGRTHQIRVHLAHVGHPLVGEKRYREPPCVEHPRQALHAWKLRIVDGPTVTTPLPNDLVELCDRLGLRVVALS